MDLAKTCPQRVRPLVPPFPSSSLPNARPYSQAMCPSLSISEPIYRLIFCWEWFWHLFNLQLSVARGRTGALTGLVTLGARGWLSQVFILYFICLELYYTKKKPPQDTSCTLDTVSSKGVPRSKGQSESPKVPAKNIRTKYECGPCTSRKEILGLPETEWARGRKRL